MSKIGFTGDIKTLFSLRGLNQGDSVELGGNTVFGNLNAALDEAKKLQATANQPASPIVDQSLVADAQHILGTESSASRNTTHPAAGKRGADTGRNA